MNARWNGLCAICPRSRKSKTMPRTTARPILLMLASFTFVSYLLRTNISVGAELMMPALGLSKIDMGQIFTSFLIGYAIFQIPGGILGDRIGPKLTLGVSVLVWGICTVLTGTVNHLFTPFVFLWIVRFVLGLAEATTYPVGTRVVYNWIPPARRAFATSLMLTGTSIGAAAASPLMSWLMVRVGWPTAFAVTSIAAFAAALIWFIFASDAPVDASPVNAPEEDFRGGLADILKSKRVVLLCCSYVCEGYVLFIFVFWLYIYLVEVRGFSMLKGGLVAALPWITGLCFTPLGGFAADRLAASHGRITGAKYVIMACYSASGLMLFAAAYSAQRIVCIVVLCLSVGFLMAGESPFWTCAAYFAGRRAGTVAGIMNTMGILGGIASTSLIPILVSRFGWLAALSSGAAMAFLCSLSWIAIGMLKPEQPLSEQQMQAHLNESGTA